MTKIPVLVDGQYHAVLLYDKPGNAKVLVEAGRESGWVARDRVTLPADHLARNEQPAPANAHYYGGVMAERLEKRR